jgi:hypothetical protein
MRRGWVGTTNRQTSRPIANRRLPQPRVSRRSGCFNLAWFPHSRSKTQPSKTMPKRKRSETPSKDEAKLLTDLGERKCYKPATKAKHLRCACATHGRQQIFRCRETMAEEDHLRGWRFCRKCRPSEAHVRSIAVQAMMWRIQHGGLQGVNISESEMQTHMRRSVRMATEMADKKCQCDCSSCCGEDKSRHASKTLAAQDTESEETP